MEVELYGVVRKVLAEVARTGLPGEHHFFISFVTKAPGVRLSQRLLEQYDKEMTIVLQNQFWDLKVNEAERTFSVGLSFGGIPSTLLVPLDAVVQFADPYARLGLRFRPVEPPEVASGPVALVPDPEPDAEPAPEAEPEGEKPAETPQVVSLDAFRRRPPPKS